MTYLTLKRTLDVVLASVGLLLSAPLQLVIAVAVRARLGTPVLFAQQRPGRGEKLFTLIKFRTMLDRDPAAGLNSDEDRLTRFGAVLRATSLDELPTLWNVLRGDMSLVGPRPLLVQYLEEYSPTERRRHAVRPGITGLAQVSGRNSLSWEEKFEKDLQYVSNMSLRLDLQILAKTIALVLLQRGIAAPGAATMPPLTRLQDENSIDETRHNV